MKPRGTSTSLPLRPTIREPALPWLMCACTLARTTRSKRHRVIWSSGHRVIYRTSHHPMPCLFSFRMISDTRIECRDANSQGETAQIGPTGTDRGGVEPGRPGSVGVDGFLSSLPQRGPYRPSLRDQPPDVLSLAAPL